MPHEDSDPSDPMTLHGVVIETESDEAHREMAACFAEEFLRMGFHPERILQMFRTPTYAGPHMAYQSLGEEMIRETIDRQASIRGPRRQQPERAAQAGRTVRLPVLDR